MKSVLMSIKPKWCELILKGEKTLEVRKTKPRIGTPFKCYIYCTLTGSKEAFESWGKDVAKWNREKWWLRKGKVIGEFICDGVHEIPIYDGSIFSLEGMLACLDDEELLKYAGEKPVYAWHISDLKIYDTPKELREFYTDCDCQGTNEVCKYYSWNCNDGFECVCDFEKPIARPPQSLCYVEEV